MYYKTVHQEIKVLSCLKIKNNESSSERWKVKCIKAFVSSKDSKFSRENLSRSFDDQTFDVVQVTSHIKLKKGVNLVLIKVEEDAEEVNGRIKVTEEIVSMTVENWEPELGGPFAKGNENESAVVKKDSFFKRRFPKKIKEIQKNEDFDFERSGLEFDYLSLIGDLHNFNVCNPKDKRAVKKILKQIGLTTDNREHHSLMLFENKEMGLKACFSNFRLGKQELGFLPNLKLEFTGHFFIRENADLVIRKIALKLMKKFGVVFTPSRVDIRQDIYGAENPFDYFPNFLDKEKHYWSLRSRPNVNFHHEGFSKDATSFTVSNSRFNITSYDRNLSLSIKLEKGEITQEYYDFYSRIYNGRAVQRLEVRLLQKDACATFYKMFMHESYDKERTLSYTLANFARNHVLRDVGLETRKSRYQENEIFKELFHLEQKDNFKKFRTKLEEKASIKFNDMIFKVPEDRLKKQMKGFGKSFCLANSKEVIEKALEGIKKIPSFIKLEQSIEENKDIKDDNVERVKETLSFFSFSLEDLEEVGLPLNRGVNIGMSYT